MDYAGPTTNPTVKLGRPSAKPAPKQPSPAPIPSPSPHQTEIPRSISAPTSLYRPPRTLEFASDLDLVKDSRLSPPDAEKKWKAILYHRPTREAGLAALRAAATVVLTLHKIKEAEQKLEGGASAMDVISNIWLLVEQPTIGPSVPLPLATPNLVQPNWTSLSNLKSQSDAEQDEVDKLYEAFKTASKKQEEEEIDAEIEFLRNRFPKK